MSRRTTIVRSRSGRKRNSTSAAQAPKKCDDISEITRLAHNTSHWKAQQGAVATSESVREAHAYLGTPPSLLAVASTNSIAHGIRFFKIPTMGYHNGELWLQAQASSNLMIQKQSGTQIRKRRRQVAVVERLLSRGFTRARGPGAEVSSAIF